MLQSLTIMKQLQKQLNRKQFKFCFYYLIIRYSQIDIILNIECFKPHILKTAGLFQPNFGSNMDEPSRWFKFLNYIFNTRFGFVHI